MKSESTYIAEAIEKLYPENSFAVADTFETLLWHNENSAEKPTKEEVMAEVAKLKSIEYYTSMRKAEYPPIEDYLDAVVKGDLVQQQAYIDACQAVKAKYPKPEEI
jgi:hypothetical protein